MTLEQIRANIEKDAVGMLYSDEIQETLKAIQEFKKQYHYLPDDVDEWHDNTIQYLQEMEEIRCEYEAYVWEKYLED